MDFIKTTFRYLNSSNKGIIGKLAQYNGKYTPRLEDAQPAHKVFEKNYLKQFDNTPIVKHRGTIAFIYTVIYKNEKIGLKFVSDKQKNIISQEKKFFSRLSKWIIKPINKDIYTGFDNLIVNISSEMDMKREYNNCLELWKCTNWEKYNIRLLRPCIELCRPNVFAYWYDNAKPISHPSHNKKEQKHLAKMCLLWVVDTLINSHIIYGDINEYNLLYDKKERKITIIDYGNVFHLNASAIFHVKNLFYHLQSDNKIYSYCKKLGIQKSEKNIINMKAAKTLLFSKKIIHFENVKYYPNIFDVDFIINHKNDCSEFITIIRIFMQYLGILKKYKISDCYGKNIDGILPSFTKKEIQLFNST